MSYVIIITNMLLFFLLMADHSIEAGRLMATPSATVIDELGYAQTEAAGAPYTFITALYVHGNIIHLMMNMLFLALLGAPFEDRVGRKNFFLIYILGGIGGSLLAGIFDPNIHGIGASGAIFAIMGGFVLKYPEDEIPFFLVFIMLPRVPVYIAAFVYGSIEFAYAALDVEDGVGHIAHINGLVAGVFAAAMLMKPEKEKFFDSLIFKTIADETEKEEFMKIGMEIERADEKDVRNAWMDTFFEKVECPDCGNPTLKMSKAGIGCQCGYIKRFSEVKLRKDE